jgi:serine/threonine-protein kinase
MIARTAKIAALVTVFLIAAGASAYLTLTLIIKSEDTVIVPELVGKDVVSALEILTDLQLNTKVSGSEYNQTFPKNHVTFQEPEAGSEIKRDRDVRIIISKGAKNILMPNIADLSDQQARMIIEENGFTRGQLSRTYNSMIEKDHVILQVPAAGTMVTRGAGVDILVSLGPRPVRYVMPDLSGNSFDRAALLIETAQLSVGDVRSSFDRRKIRNSVIRQEPPAGYSVIANSAVNLVINRPSGSADGDRLHHPLYGSLLQHRIKNGFLKKRVRIELTSAAATSDIFEDYVKPGEEIWVLVPRDHDATVHIFEDEDLVGTRLFEAW